MTGWKGDSQGIVQAIKVLPYFQMVYAQTRFLSREPLGF